jgi:hypothetical protein
LPAALSNFYKTLVAFAPGDSQASFVVLGRFLGINPDDTEFSKRLAELGMIPQRLRVLLHSLDEDGLDFIADELNKVDNMFSVVAQSNSWVNNIGRVDGGLFVALRALSQRLDSKGLSEPDAEEDRLSEISEEIRSLITQLETDTELNRDLIAILLDHLFGMDRAVSLYRFAGATLLRSELKRVIGAVAIGDLPATSSTAVKKFIKIVAAVALLIGLANDVPQLVERVSHQFAIDAPAPTVKPGGNHRAIDRVAQPLN